MTVNESEAWLAFKNIMHNFLGNNKHSDFENIMSQRCWINCSNCHNMSINITENFGDFSE